MGEEEVTNFCIGKLLLLFREDKSAIDNAINLFFTKDGPAADQAKIFDYFFKIGPVPTFIAKFDKVLPAAELILRDKQERDSIALTLDRRVHHKGQ